MTESTPRDFFSPFTHGFVRAAVCSPLVRVADPATNAARTLELARKASGRNVCLAVYPELGVTAYTAQDLFHQDALLLRAQSALEEVIRGSADINSVLVIGAPLRVGHGLYNCAVVIHRGRCLGVVPKSYLPNYREFYEKRHFVSGYDAPWRSVRLAGEEVPFGPDVVFAARGMPGFVFHVEVCEDLWAPVPPSTHAALAGALLLANCSASNITMGKAAYRRTLCLAQSGKCLAAYLYAAAGRGESTTDLAWDGYALIVENEDLLAESERFLEQDQMLLADIDTQRLLQDRIRSTTFHDAAARDEAAGRFRRVEFDFAQPVGERGLLRPVERFPYVPADPASRDERCFEVVNIQVQGLAQRMRAASIDRPVVGVSGGLDSTLALIVAARTTDLLRLPRTNILAVTLPGFATSAASMRTATRLIDALGAEGLRIDIRPSCRRMFRDIGHPFAQGKPVYDVTFENVQAGDRASHLFRLANHRGGLVVGTGDLSEIALGWNTYGVGDHMSHYNVNTSVPKTLVQHLIRWVIHTGQFSRGVDRALSAVLKAEISPELVPPGAENQDRVQSTEAVVGPFALQDFHLYYISRFGFAPSKVAFLALHAWGDISAGSWPEPFPPEARRAFTLPEIKHWLTVFCARFFAASQFKRSAMPDGPKVGSGGSLSPRADWRAPSDAAADAWLEDLRDNVP